MAIRRCDCTHKFQDKRYGKGNRVHNPGRGPSSVVVWVCTVCGKRK